MSGYVKADMLTAQRELQEKLRSRIPQTRDVNIKGDPYGLGDLTDDLT